MQTIYIWHKQIPNSLWTITQFKCKERYWIKLILTHCHLRGTVWNNSKAFLVIGPETSVPGQKHLQRNIHVTYVRCIVENQYQPHIYILWTISLHNKTDLRCIGFNVKEVESGTEEGTCVVQSHRKTFFCCEYREVSTGWGRGQSREDCNLAIVFWQKHFLFLKTVTQKTECSLHTIECDLKQNTICFQHQSNYLHVIKVCQVVTLYPVKQPSLLILYLVTLILNKRHFQDKK